MTLASREHCAGPVSDSVYNSPQVKSGVKLSISFSNERGEFFTVLTDKQPRLPNDMIGSIVNSLSGA